jgi:hypothetical protein
MPIAVAARSNQVQRYEARLPSGSEYEKYRGAAALGFQSLNASDKFTGRVQPAYSARPQIRFRVVCLAERSRAVCLAAE